MRETERKKRNQNKKERRMRLCSRGEHTNLFSHSCAFTLSALDKEYSRKWLNKAPKNIIRRKQII
jgi:hypothetical protein